MRELLSFGWGLFKVKSFYDLVGVKTSYQELFFEFHVIYEKDFDLFYAESLMVVKELDDEFKISAH